MGWISWNSALAVVAAVIALSSPAGAFQLEGQKWPQSTTTFLVNIPGANGIWNSAFETAMDDWNAATIFQYMIVRNTFQDPCDQSANGVAFATTECGDQFGSAIAISSRTWDVATNLMLHSGIVFNSNVSWDVYSGPLKSGINDFRRVAVHELGHSLGLAHETQVPAIMAPVESDIELPTADDIAGVQFIYTGSSSEQSSLVSALLPSSRAVAVDGTATAFVTIINAGNVAAASCSIAPLISFDGTFSYQTTDPRTNALVGTPNTPANIAAGASQSFVIALSPASAMAPTDVAFKMICGNTLPAPGITGLNTLLLSAQTSPPIPDMVALAATASSNGVLQVAPTGEGAFAVATVNLGASATITVSADTGSASLPLTLTLCQTDANGACLSSPAASATASVPTNGTPTFSIFATAQSTISFDPANNRIFVRFRDSSGTVRGSTSVAIRND